jgi:hypothetical protein
MRFRGQQALNVRLVTYISLLLELTFRLEHLKTVPVSLMAYQGLLESRLVWITGSWVRVRM